MDIFAEQLEIVHRQWKSKPFSFEGEHYRLVDSDPLPKPVQSPHPPLIVGGRGGPRSVALAARWADEYNTVSPDRDECRALRGRIAEACEREGREPLPLSVMTRSSGSPTTRCAAHRAGGGRRLARDAPAPGAHGSRRAAADRRGGRAAAA